MERVESNDLKVSGSRETEVEVKLEIKEEFWGEVDGIHSEEMIVDSGVERFSNSSEVISRLSKDVRLPSRCRLCALPNYNMVDIFNSYKIEDDIVEQIKYCLRIVVRSHLSFSKHKFIDVLLDFCIVCPHLSIIQRCGYSHCRVTMRGT